MSEPRRSANRIGRIVAFVAVGAGALLAGFLLHWALQPAGEPTGGKTPEQGRGAAGAEAPNESEEQIWTCSMHPQIRREEPGQCPICGMDLIPVRREQASGLREMTTTRQGRALMDIQTSPVVRRYATAEIRMVGKVTTDETRVEKIAAWVPGRIDQLYVDYTGTAVRKGDHMVRLYSPELLSAQEELLQARRSRGDFERSSLPSIRESGRSTFDAAREKLRLLGLTPEQIERILERGSAEEHVTIYAPAGGIVLAMHANEGDYVKTGQPIYTVADLSHVWVKLDAYESDLQWLRYGQKITFTTDALPGEEFVGRITFIDPVLDPRTRTVDVRVDVPNSRGRLKPQMFVRGVVRAQVAAGGKVMAPDLAGKWICPMHPSVISDEPDDCRICGMPLERTDALGYVPAEKIATSAPLVVPASSVLVTGRRAVVYVEIDPMLLRPVDLLDVVGLIDEIRRQAMAEEPSPGKHLWRRFDARLVADLGALEPSELPSEQLVRGLVGELNRLLTRRDFYAPAAWQGIDVGEEAAALIEHDVDELSSRELLTLNRRLLEAAYRGMISKAIDKPTFVGREVLLGPRAGDFYIVRNGLSEGDAVVTQGTFKIDSALQIKASPSMMSPTGGAAPSGEEQAAALPERFKAQAAALDEQFQRIGGALKADDLPAVRKAFGDFLERLKEVNGLLLSGDRRAAWNELEMLLENDAVEGHRYAESLDEAARTLDRMAATMGRLRERFRLQSTPAEKLQPGEMVAPEEFKRQLAGVWQAYLDLRTALFNDDAGAAGEAVDAARKALGQVDMSLLEGPAHMRWMKEGSALETILSGMDEAEGLEALRAGFARTSEQMAVLLRTFGVAGGGRVHVLRCPMAFDGRGATWLQTEAEVANPYFGEAMPACGSVINTIDLDQAGATPRTDDTDTEGAGLHE